MYHSNDGIYKLGDLGMTSSSADLAPGGTIPYLSPETLFSGSISSQTDIYSLGASLYILSGGDKSDLINRTASTTLVKPPIIGEQFFEVILERQQHEKKEQKSCQIQKTTPHQHRSDRIWHYFDISGIYRRVGHRRSGIFCGSRDGKAQADPGCQPEEDCRGSGRRSDILRTVIRAVRTDCRTIQLVDDALY